MGGVQEAAVVIGVFGMVLVAVSAVMGCGWWDQWPDQ